MPEIWGTWHHQILPNSSLFILLPEHWGSPGLNHVLDKWGPTIGWRRQPKRMSYCICSVPSSQEEAGSSFYFKTEKEAVQNPLCLFILYFKYFLILYSSFLTHKSLANAEYSWHSELNGTEVCLVVLTEKWQEYIGVQFLEKKWKIARVVCTHFFSCCCGKTLWLK